MDGRNLRIDIGGPPAILTAFADTQQNWSRLRLTSSSQVVARRWELLLQATRAVPIIFVLVPDPVGAGYVGEFGPAGRQRHWFYPIRIRHRREMAGAAEADRARLTRVAVLRDPAITAGIGQLGAIQAAAPSFGVELSPIDVRDASEIERAVSAFARTSNGGLILSVEHDGVVHRELIIALAARHRLPAVYFTRFFVTGGGLISYGADTIDVHRLAAGYVDRILKGEKPADLPVQASTKLKLVINLKTAKALGIDIPTTLLATADEVIE